MGRVATADAQRFMMECLKAVGAGCKPASQQAELLIVADMAGHSSHGLNRLEIFVNDIAQKRCLPNNVPMVLKQTEATAWVDANNVLGATASHFGMDLAIKKAQKTGVGWVSVKGSNHNGIVSFWDKKAACKGMVGMSFTSIPLFLAPTRNIKAYKTKCIMPGGGELSSGFKGYGLAAVVEMFCGVLAGANYGHRVPNRTIDGTGAPSNYGQCFVAVNPGCFAPGFRQRLTDCMLRWRSLEPMDPSYPVLCPGEKAKQAASKTHKRGTVSYVEKQIENSAALAKRLNVKPMTVLK